jgi:hypothetical protein
VILEDFFAKSAISVMLLCEKEVTFQEERVKKCSPWNQDARRSEKWGNAVVPAADCHSANSIPWQIATLHFRMAVCLADISQGKHCGRVLCVSQQVYAFCTLDDPSSKGNR